MKKGFILLLISVSTLFSQTDFWSHYNLDTPVYQLVNYGDSILIAVRDIDIIKSTDMALSWDTIYTTPYPCSVWTKLKLIERKVENGQIYLIVNQENGYSACTQPLIYISTNSGQDWQELNLPNEYFGDIDITSNGTLVLASDTAYYSTNIGTSWNYLNIPSEGRLGWKIEIDSNDNLFITKYHGTWFQSEFVFKSINFGQTWLEMFHTVYNPNSRLLTLFHTENGEIIASDNVSPKTWYLKGNLIDDFPIYYTSSAVVLNSKFFFASPPCCNNQGIRYSSNFGQNWVSQNTGLTSLECYSIIKDTLGYLYVGTSDGIFKSNSSAYLTSLDLDEGKIENFYLSNCYPNPFNPLTTIEYSVPKRSNVRISVFNLLGEEIDILVNEEKENGNFRIDFDGRDLSSGVYFYKMQAENFVVTMKFVLLK